MSQPEEIFALDSGDGFTVYGRINRAGEGTAQKAVVLCHGLTGHINVTPVSDAKRYFTQRGYDVIRMSFYSDQDNARAIADCTVAIHAKDLNTVLAHFAPQYAKLFVAGHSYGGLTILTANPENVAAISFWDGTFVPGGEEDSQWAKYWQPNEALDDCIVTYPPVSMLLGMPMYEEKLTFTEEYLGGIAKAIKTPSQVLAAGDNSENIPNQKSLFDALESEKEFYLIPGAGHCFYEDDTVFDLLEKTYAWFERF